VFKVFIEEVLPSVCVNRLVLVFVDVLTKERLEHLRAAQLLLQIEQ